MHTLTADDLWGREAWSRFGQRLGRVEAVGMGRDRAPRRVGVRLEAGGPALTFFSLAGASLVDGRLVLDTGPSLQVVSGCGC